MQKLIRFWQNLRLRAKFLLILLVGIVPVGIVAIVTLYIPLRAYDRQSRNFVNNLRICELCIPIISCMLCPERFY